MTEEQIIQNAGEYASFGRSAFQTYDEYAQLRDAYIAGAHSRDEEIEELKEEIESLKENEKELFEGFKKRGAKLGELMKENVKLRNDNKDLEQALACAEDVVDIQRKELKQLRNPWISVEERLPEDKQKTLWIRSDGNMFLGEFHKHESGGLYFTSTDAVSDARLKGVTHWMPIPQIEKGGEK